MEEEVDVTGSRRRKFHDNLSSCLTTTKKRRHSQPHPDHHHHHHHQVNSVTTLTPKPDLDVVKLTYDLTFFPDSLLQEIIVRLPVKSIFIFKCVSKHWQSLISHPSVSRSFLSRCRNDSAASESFRMLYRYIYVPKFTDAVDRFSFSPYIYNSPNFPVLFLSTHEEKQTTDQFKVLGSSNGLILICSTAPLSYYVCDPVTKKWLSLPQHNIDSCSSYPLFVGETIVSQVDQENVVSSFKVVRVRSLTLEPKELELDIYSSETGKWINQSLLCSHPIQLLKRGCGPIHFNGYLHWFVPGGMVAFNPYKYPKSCRLINFPKDMAVESESTHDGLYRLCDECQGELRFFEVSTKYSDFYLFSMWVLEDYKKGEWVLKFKVTRSEVWSHVSKLSNGLMSAAFVPLSFHPFDSDVVYLRCVEPSCIVLYNISNKRVDVLRKPIGVDEHLSWRVVMPFMMPMWPTPVPIPPKKAAVANQEIVTRPVLKFRSHGIRSRRHRRNY